MEKKLTFELERISANGGYLLLCGVVMKRMPKNYKILFFVIFGFILGLATFPLIFLQNQDKLIAQHELVAGILLLDNIQSDIEYLNRSDESGTEINFHKITCKHSRILLEKSKASGNSQIPYADHIALAKRLNAITTKQAKEAGVFCNESKPMVN